MSAKQDPRTLSSDTGATRSVITLVLHPAGYQGPLTSSADAWQILAGAVLQALAATGTPFTRDDISERGIDEPERRREWNRLFAWYESAGLIVKLGEIPAPRPGYSRRRVDLWQGTPLAYGVLDEDERDAA